MATRLPDGSIQMSDGRIIFANSVILGGDLIEILPLLTPPPAWPFVSGGGGGGSGNGTPGARGADGAPGPQGPQGTNPGVQGPQGLLGVQGNQGSIGAGVQGPQGTLGTQGNQGTFGPQGFQGAGGGAQGNQGAQGSGGAGAQGVQGFQGAGGGAQGFQGFQGFQGDDAGRVYIFASPSVLTTTDNALIPWLPGQGDRVDFFQCSVKTAPTGAAINVDFKLVTLATGVVGATIATVSIAAGSFYGSTTLGTPVTVQPTQALAMEITQVGSTIAGSDLVGTAQGPASVMPIFAFSESGNVTTTDNALIPWVPGQGAPISLFSAVVKTAPTGASIIIDFKVVTMSTGVVGATIATVTIPAGSFYSTTTLGSPVTILTTEALAAEISQVGSIISGANLTAIAQ